MRSTAVAFALCLCLADSGIVQAESRCPERFDGNDIRICPPEQRRASEGIVLNKEYLPGRGWQEERVIDGERQTAIFDKFPEWKLTIAVDGRKLTANTPTRFYECTRIGETLTVEYCDWPPEVYVRSLSRAVREPSP